MIHLKKFLLGAAFGVMVGWSADSSVVDEYLRLVGKDRELDNDNLSSADLNLSIEERREIFRQNLLKYGPSVKLQYMITDFNYNLILNNSPVDSRPKSEIDMLEEQFRKYYPELFDKTRGHDFIISLNLKTKCNDHNIPRVLKPKYSNE